MSLNDEYEAGSSSPGFFPLVLVAVVAVRMCCVARRLKLWCTRPIAAAHLAPDKSQTTKKLRTGDRMEPFGLVGRSMRETGQSHFKIWEVFVLKGHGFSRAEEGGREGIGL